MSVPPALRPLLETHGRRRLLVDANLLLLYFVGSVARRLIRSHPRLSGYSEDEFQLLAQIIQHFQTRGKIFTTPHILTEITNLSDRLHGPDRQQFFHLVASQTKLIEEYFEPARTLIGTDIFPVYGLTDAAITSLARKENLLAITADNPLAGELRRRKLAVIPFVEIRHYCLAE